MKDYNQFLRKGAEDAEGFYLAGQMVAAGTYREVGTFRSIQLDHDDYLPASLNGRVAVYVRRPTTFAELQKQQTPYAKTG